MMTLLLFLLVAILLGGTIYLSTLDGEYVIRRSRWINVAPDVLFEKLRDFKSWPQWSPWLIHEPDCKLTYSDSPAEEGGYYEWDGKHIGAGRLTHVSFDKDTRIVEKLQFTRPFKSICDVEFELVAKDGGTELSWIMHGKMPFLFRFMTKKTVWMISKDYDFGLARLAGVMDPQADHPRLAFNGAVKNEAWNVHFLNYQGGVEGMMQTMEEAFPKLIEYAGDELSDQLPCTLYNKVDPVKMEFDCDLCVPAGADSSTSEYDVKAVPGGEYFKATLQGSYEFLELAWYSAMAHLHMHKIKLDKSRPSIELYHNNPNDTPNKNDIVTELLIPIK